MVSETYSDGSRHSKKKDGEDPKETSVTFTEIFQLVCVQYGVVSVPYFLDKMKPYELSIICDSLHLRHKEEWEQSRMVAYITAQVNSKKKLKPTDIIKFAWEQEKEKTKPVKNTLTLDDVEQIKQAALQREKELKQLGII